MYDQMNIDSLQYQANVDGIEKIIAGAFIVDEGRFLILKRSPTEDFMAGFDEIPSGHADEGESIQQALIREVYEETGLAVTEGLSFANSFDYLSRSGKKVRQFNFFVKVGDGEIILNPSEHSEYKWVYPSSQEFIELNLSQETRACISDACRALAATNEPKYIVIDGVDAVGKTTQVQEIKKKVEHQIRVHVLSEFSESEIGDLIRDNIRRNQFFRLSDSFNAAKAETVLLISDLLFKNGTEISAVKPHVDMVIADREIPSLIAYQSIRLSRQGQEYAQSWLKSIIEGCFLNERRADLRIILTLNELEIRRRCEARGETLSENDMEFLMEAQLIMAQDLDTNTVILDVSDMSREEVSSMIISEINNRFGWKIELQEQSIGYGCNPK